MKTFVLCFVLVAALAMATARPEEEHYTNRWDSIDLDAIIKNDRLLGNYIECLCNERKCNADGEELKRVLPDALKNHCKKCTPNQEKGAKKVLRHLIKNKREWFDKLAAIYDQDGTYIKEYEAELKTEGIKL